MNIMIDVAQDGGVVMACGQKDLHTGRPSRGDTRLCMRNPASTPSDEGGIVGPRPWVSVHGGVLEDYPHESPKEAL